MVSDEGAVLSLRRTIMRSNGSPQYVSGGIMKQHLDRKGYAYVAINYGGRRRNVYVHQAVASAFLGPQPKGSETRHLDGDKANNSLRNLAYGTQSENMIDRVRHGTHHNAIKTHCPMMHPYPASAGGRNKCATCARTSKRFHTAYRRTRAQSRRLIASSQSAADLLELYFGKKAA